MNENKKNCFKEMFNRTIYSTKDYKKYYPNLAMFHLSFDPPLVKVTEEYVIYDTVALISALGGTLGLCVGFSFQDLISTLLGLCETIITYLTRDSKEKRTVKVKPNTEDMAESLAKLETQIHEMKQTIRGLVSYVRSSY